jgi:flagellar biosynthesis chaperone FliJ
MDDEEIKRLRRLAKNRDSARECRKRKRNRYEHLTQQLVHLEAENLQLRMKLKMGPESEGKETEDTSKLMNNLDVLVKEGASDEDIKAAVTQIQEKYSDYGRDRKSALAFHLTALRRCLQPTQTTRTILWLMSCVEEFHEADGTLITTKSGEVAELWYSLLRDVNSSPDQNNSLVRLSGSSFMSTEFPKLQEVTTYTESIINRLEALVTNKNESLDSEMKKLQSQFTVKQIAKFILWISKNPACMQMLEALWPHLCSELASRGGVNVNLPPLSGGGSSSNSMSSNGSRASQSLSGSFDPLQLAHADGQDSMPPSAPFLHHSSTGSSYSSDGAGQR